MCIRFSIVPLEIAGSASSSEHKDISERFVNL